MHTSWSEIDTARHCLRKHHYRYKERWVDREESQPLTIGNRWHELMELLYTTGDPAKPVDKAASWLAEEPGTHVAETLVWMLHGYFEQWGLGDPLWVANTEMVEVEIYVDLPDIGYGPLPLKGYIDLTVSLTKKLWVVDHKSGTSAPRPRDLEMADQWTLYCWALREMGYKPFGSVHNYARTDKLKREMTLAERFARVPIHRTDREMEAVAREAAIDAWRAKIDNGAPRAPGEMCYRRCSFADTCIADRRYGSEIAVNIIQQKHEQEQL